MGKYLWICVTADEYELPLAVADTSTELAKMCGTSKSNVMQSVRLNCNGSLTGRKFMKVRNEDEFTMGL